MARGAWLIHGVAKRRTEGSTIFIMFSLVCTTKKLESIQLNKENNTNDHQI